MLRRSSSVLIPQRRALSLYSDGSAGSRSTGVAKATPHSSGVPTGNRMSTLKLLIYLVALPVALEITSSAIEAGASA